MKLPEKAFSKIVLASLPFFVYSKEPAQIFTVGTLTVLAFWWTTIFFWCTRFWFPKNLLKIAFLIWLGALAEGAWLLGRINPIWIVSIFLLMPLSFLERKNKAFKEPVFSENVKKYFWERFFCGVGFLGIVVFVGMLQNVLENQMHVDFFKSSPGIFLVFSIIALLRAKQPGERA